MFLFLEAQARNIERTQTTQKPLNKINKIFGSKALPK